MKMRFLHMLSIGFIIFAAYQIVKLITPLPSWLELIWLVVSIILIVAGGVRLLQRKQNQSN